MVVPAKKLKHRNDVIDEIARKYQIKNEELDKLKKQMPKLADFMNDTSFLRHFIDTTRKRTVRSASVAVMTVMVLMEMLEQLKQLNENIKFMVPNKKEAVIEDDKPDAEAAPSGRKLKNLTKETEEEDEA